MRIEVIGIVCIFVIAIFFSTYKLSESPGVWYDEGFYDQLAMNEAAYGQIALQVAPQKLVSATYVTVGYPLTYPLALSIKLFGAGVLQTRAVMALYIVAAIAASYILTRMLFGWEAAVLSGLLLATFPLLYGNGKTAIGEVPGFFFLVLFLISLAYLERKKYVPPATYAAGGLTLGLCIVTKPILLLALPAFAVVLAIKYKSIGLRPKYIAVAAACFLVPVLWWIHTQFSPGDSFASIFARYANPYEISDLWQAVFINALRFFTESTPLYFAMLSGAWALAIGVRMYKKIDISLAEWCAFAFVALIAAAYLRTAGWYRYFFLGHITAILFFAPSLLYFRFKKYVFAGTVIFVLLLSGYQLSQLVRGSFVAQYYDSTQTAGLSAYFSSVDTKKKIFLYDTPELAIFLKTQNYYQYMHPVDTLEIGKDQLSVLAAGVPDVVLVRKSEYKSTDTRFLVYRKSDTIGGFMILQRP